MSSLTSHFFSKKDTTRISMDSVCSKSVRERKPSKSVLRHIFVILIILPITEEIISPDVFMGTDAKLIRPLIKNHTPDSIEDVITVQRVGCCTQEGGLHTIIKGDCFQIPVQGLGVGRVFSEAFKTAIVFGVAHNDPILDIEQPAHHFVPIKDVVVVDELNGFGVGEGGLGVFHRHIVP